MFSISDTASDTRSEKLDSVNSQTSAVRMKVDGNLCFLRYVRLRDVLGSRGGGFYVSLWEEKKENSFVSQPDMLCVWWLHSSTPSLGADKSRPSSAPPPPLLFSVKSYPLKLCTMYKEVFDLTYSVVARAEREGNEMWSRKVQLNLINNNSNPEQLAYKVN